MIFAPRAIWDSATEGATEGDGLHVKQIGDFNYCIITGIIKIVVYIIQAEREERYFVFILRIFARKIESEILWSRWDSIPMSNEGSVPVETFNPFASNRT